MNLNRMTLTLGKFLASLLGAACCTLAAITPASAQPSGPISPDIDFVPVAWLAKFHLTIATGGDGPHKTLGDLVAFYNANPTKANFGTSAAGRQLHVPGGMLGQAANW